MRQVQTHGNQDNPIAWAIPDLGMQEAQDSVRKYNRLAKQGKPTKWVQGLRAKDNQMNLTKRPISAKGKKPKKAKLSTLIAKADTLASLYIRQKYADHAGNVKCVSCDSVLHWKESHCAHFIERGKKATRWLEENLHVACCSCNTFNKERHMRGYTLFMMDTYGREMIDELRELEKKMLSATEVRNLAEEAINYYSKEQVSWLTTGQNR